MLTLSTFIYSVQPSFFLPPEQNLLTKIAKKKKKVWQQPCSKLVEK